MSNLWGCTDITVSQIASWSAVSTIQRITSSTKISEITQSMPLTYFLNLISGWLNELIKSGYFNKYLLIIKLLIQSRPGGFQDAEYMLHAYSIHT